LFQAITEDEIVDHHRAGKDAKNTTALAMFSPFWERRLNLKGGLDSAATAVADKKDGIDRAAKSVCHVFLKLFNFGRTPFSGQKLENWGFGP
jgi:hypothetical protein